MIYSDNELYNLIKKGELEISPTPLEQLKEDEQIQPASIDLRLGNSFSRLNEPEKGFIKLDKKQEYETKEADTYYLTPGEFILATTKEHISLPPYMAAWVEGRSSYGRLGLFIENAGWVDPGFKGEITLELYNANRYPIELKAGVRICQLVFAEMSKEPIKPYNGKYMDQRGATGSRVYLDCKQESMT